AFVSQLAEFLRVEFVAPGSADDVGLSCLLGKRGRVHTELDGFEHAGLRDFPADVVHFATQQQPGVLIGPEAGRDLPVVPLGDHTHGGALPNLGFPFGADPEVGFQHVSTSLPTLPQGVDPTSRLVPSPVSWSGLTSVPTPGWWRMFSRAVSVRPVLSTQDTTRTPW